MDKKTPMLYLKDFPSTVAMLEELSSIVELFKQERSSAYAILHYSVE